MSPDPGCLHPTAETPRGNACNLQRGEEDWLERISGTWRICKDLPTYNERGTEVRDGRCVVLTSLRFATVFG